jgi:uroporphyrinogen-III synthase
VSRFALITRHPSDCGELQGLLEPCGITLRPYPVLRIEDSTDDEGWRTVADQTTGLDKCPWLVLASPRAPRRFVVNCTKRDLEILLAIPAAAVGPSTAQATEEVGIEIDLIGPGTGEGLARELVQHLGQPTTFIFPCGHDRRPELPQILTEAGHTVLPVEVYRMVPTPPRELPPLGPSLDAVVLTSPRAAGLYLEGVGGLPLPCLHWALGPTTQAAAAALGVECLTPDEPTMQSLAEELCKN